MESKNKEKLKAENLKKNEAVIQNAEDKLTHEEEVEKAVLKDQKESFVPKTATVAKGDVLTDEALRLAQEKATASGLTNATGTLFNPGMESFMLDEHGRRTHPNDVKFEVKYGSGFKGSKHMAEGVTVVSREVAEQFESLHMGKIIEK